MVMITQWRSPILIAAPLLGVATFCGSTLMRLGVMAGPVWLCVPFGLLVLVLAWRLLWHPRVVLESETLIIRYPFHSHHVPLAAIADLDHTAFGVVVLTVDGHRHPTLTLQKNNFAHALGVRTKVDEALAAIRHQMSTNEGA